MKVRADFVTNSSSSSYIISAKLTDNEDVTILLENILNSISHYTVSNKEELDRFIIDEYSYGSIDTVEKIIEDDSYVEEKYNKLLEAINNNESLHFYNIDYEDDAFGKILYAIEKSNFGKVLEDGQ